MSLLGIPSKRKDAGGIQMLAEMPSIPDTAIGQEDIGLLLSQMSIEKRAADSKPLAETIAPSVVMVPFASAWMPKGK